MELSRLEKKIKEKLETTITDYLDGQWINQQTALEQIVIYLGILNRISQYKRDHKLETIT